MQSRLTCRLYIPICKVHTDIIDFTCRYAKVDFDSRELCLSIPSSQVMYLNTIVSIQLSEVVYLNTIVSIPLSECAMARANKLKNWKPLSEMQVAITFLWVGVSSKKKKVYCSREGVIVMWLSTVRHSRCWDIVRHSRCWDIVNPL